MVFEDIHSLMMLPQISGIFDVMIIPLGGNLAYVFQQWRLVKADHSCQI